MICVWKLGSECNTRSEILIICHAILRHWLLASNLRPPFQLLCRRCYVLYWTLDNLYITHDKHYMNSKEWIRIIYVCNDPLNLSLGIGFFICSTELRKGTFFLHLLVMDGCWFFSRPSGLCVNSDYGQLPFLCQVWARLCVMYHQPCYQMGGHEIYLSTAAYFLTKRVFKGQLLPWTKCVLPSQPLILSQHSNLHNHKGKWQEDPCFQDVA